GRQRGTEIRLVDQVIPVRNDVVDRTGVMAEGRAAIHAARTLPAQLVLGQRLDEFAPMLEPVLDRCIGAVAPLELEKTRWIAHGTQAPTAMLTSGRSVARARACICCWARRYSIGITLTKRAR